MEQSQEQKLEQYRRELEHAREREKLLLNLRDNPKKRR